MIGDETKTCRYCGCSFKSGKGVNKKGHKYTTFGWILAIVSLGFIPAAFSGWNLQCYCSRACQQNDRK